MSAFKRRDAAVVRRLTLDLSLADEKRKITEKIARSLSGVDQQGECLFVGSDEGPGFERLQRTGKKTYGRRDRFGLGDFFKGLPGKDKDEADVESISIHKGWLWLVTSHARTRPKLRDEEEGSSDVEAFARPEFHPRRYVLGRIPLLGANGDTPTPVERDGKRQAWWVPVSGSGSALTEALAQDDHLKHALTVPAKENGLDIEGIAVRDGRVVLGLRGPVLRGEAILLDLELSPEKAGMGLAGHRSGVSYRKRFLDLGGLGVRDLCRRKKNLFILAGPSMPLPAPYRVYALPGFFEAEDGSEVLTPQYLCDVPAEEGRNPEGVSAVGGQADEFIMVMDGERSANGLRARACVIRVPEPDHE
jgi:Protein of unknown function (DUF3616)